MEHSEHGLGLSRYYAAEIALPKRFGNGTRKVQFVEDDRDGSDEPGGGTRRAAAATVCGYG